MIHPSADENMVASSSSNNNNGGKHMGTHVIGKQSNGGVYVKDSNARVHDHGIDVPRYEEKSFDKAISSQAHSKSKKNAFKMYYREKEFL